MRKKLFVLLLIAASLLSASCNIFRNRFDKSIDTATGMVMLEGIHQQVVIRRDGLGIPLIEAENEDDLFFGAGYATATDRLWQMYMMTMAMQGRLSEMAGEDMLKMDVFMRTLNAKKFVDEAMKKIDPRSRQVLVSFSKGVNSYLNSHENLPAEFVLADYRPREWRPEDSLFVFGMLNLNVSFNFLEELHFLVLAGKVGYARAAALCPVYPDEPLPLSEALKLKEVDPQKLVEKLAGLGPLQKNLRSVLGMGIPASNNWALSGRRTDSGKSIVCNDTHLFLMIPNSWMIMHLKCPTYNAAGVTAPGIPIVTLGYNGKIAWGATMVMADSQDIFLEKMRYDNVNPYYFYKGSYRAAVVRKEVFQIKDDDPIAIKIVETRHGPLLNEALSRLPYPQMLPVQPLPLKSDYGIAISWALHGGEETFKAFFSMGDARSMKEAKRALLKVKSIYLNIVYGDKNNIAWQVTGSFPRRKKGKGMLPSPGWSGAYDWEGYTETTKNPAVLNPDAGFLATANNRTVAPDFPLNMTSSWYHPDRSERLHQVLKKMKKGNMEAMRALQFDHYSPMARKIQKLIFDSPVKEEILKAVAGLSSGSDRRRAARALKMLAPEKFDCVMKITSAPAALTGAFVHAVTRNIFLDELGPEKEYAWQSFLDLNMMSYGAVEDHLQARKYSPFWDDRVTKGRETRAQILARSLADAYRFCEKHLGSESRDWQWGKLHTYHWKHDITKETRFFHKYFNRGPYPAGGDCHSLNVGTFSWGENFDVFNIPAMRLIVDFGREDPAWLIMTPGQSGNPSSRHYGDMIPYYLQGKQHPLPFNQKGIEEQYQDILRLVPRN